MPHRSIVGPMVESKIEKDNTTIEVFRIKYEQQSTHMAKLLLIVLVPFTAIPITLVNYSKKMFFIDHLMVSLEFNSIIILFANVALPWLIILLNTLLNTIGYSLQFLLQDKYISMIFGILAITSVKLNVI